MVAACFGDDETGAIFTHATATDHYGFKHGEPIS
jgi:hypothetical protein